MGEMRFNHAGAEKLRAAVGNERGMALIIVLIMLLLLSILGATILTSTTSDLRITGTTRNVENTFFTADAAMEYAESSDLIYSALIPDTTQANHIWPPAGGGDWPLGNSTDPSFKTYKTVQVGNQTAEVKVEYLNTGPVPAGMGSQTDSGLGSGTGFQANYYVVSVVAMGTNNDSRMELESQVIKIVPK